MLVEAAIVLPLVILFILGLMEYSRYLMTLHVFTNAVTVGATYAARHTDPIYFNGTTYGNANSNVTTIVTNALAGQQRLQVLARLHGDGLAGADRQL